MTVERGGPYPSREELQTRAPHGESPIPDDASTALDPVRFTPEFLAEREARRSQKRVEVERPAEADTRSFRLAALVVVGLACFFGALVGAWLALQ